MSEFAKIFVADVPMSECLFEHLTTLEVENPVAAAQTLLRKAQGRAYGVLVGRYTRLDGAYTCFEMKDGSIFAIDNDLKASDEWPWCLAVANRGDWEIFMTGVDREVQNALFKTTVEAA